MEYRSGAYLQIAGIKLQKQYFSNAIEYAKKSLDNNLFNIGAYEFMITCYRKLNDNKESPKNTHELLEIDPLNHYA